MRFCCASLLVVCAHLWQVSSIYVPLRQYAGTTFFDGWDFYGNVDNTTWGNVTYLDQPNAMAHRLTYVNEAGNAIVKVDNTTTIADAAIVNRESIRLTSKDTYGVGTVVIIDALHLPYGCSVWPSFWTLGIGAEWPQAGEIDIIEGNNLMDHNQMALHTTEGCTQAANPVQSGQTLSTNCASSNSSNRGCSAAETKQNSFGSGFAQAGGGVYALQMDISGVFIWFWSRPDIPESIKTATPQSTMDTTTFGMPSASYPAKSCNITQYFPPQQLVLLITLCGHWAGIPSVYSSTCPGTCIGNIIGPGSPTYDTAYWEIPYIRTYIAEGAAPPPASSSNSSTTPSSPATSPLAAVTNAPTGSVKASSGTRMSLSSTVLSLLCISLCVWNQLF